MNLVVIYALTNELEEQKIAFYNELALHVLIEKLSGRFLTTVTIVCAGAII